MSKEFLLSDFWQPAEVSKYKVHFARRNDVEEPLNTISRSIVDWQKWQEWHPAVNAFNRPFVFALAQVPQAKDQWMFGGIWRVCGEEVRQDGRCYYIVDLEEDLKPLVGRMKLHRVHRQRGTRLNFENHYGQMILHEILPKH